MKSPKMKKYLPIPILGIFSIILCYSCVKDTDFGATDDISIQPVFEIDLVYFDVDASTFYDQEVLNGSVTISDTTDILFISDSELGSDFNRIEFYFRFENSISKNIEAEIQFLNEGDLVKYQILADVLPGTMNLPIVTEVIENVEGNDLNDLTKAEKLVINLTISEPDKNLTGTINLQSKATYYFEF